MPKEHDDRRRDDDRLADAIQNLACEIKEFREQVRVDSETITILHGMDRKLDKIMATQADLAADLRAVRAQQEKTAAEIAAVQEAQTVALEKITELEAVIAAGVAPTPELVDAVAAVKAQAQIVDDLIPDLTVPPVE